MMKILAVLALFWAAVSASDVLDLGDSDFDTALEDHDTALVMFYAPWCGHCKRLKPEFEKAASNLKSNDPPVALAKVDCTEAGKDTCSRFEVKGYPTLKIFRNGEIAQDYNGPREQAGITKFMASQVGAASKEVKTEDEMKTLLASKKEVVVMGLLEDSSDMDVFQKVANKLRESVAFGHSSKSLSGKKGIVLFRPKHLQTKMEASEVVYDGKMDKGDIEKWIKANYHGLVGHRTFDNAKEFEEPLCTVYFGVDYVKNVKGTNYWRNRVMKVAKGFKGELTFAISNEDDFQQEANEFGLEVTTEEKPMVAIKSKAGKFIMKDEFNVENFEKFINDYEAGKLEVYMKSEDIPEDNDGGVKVAVGKNFHELVTVNEKDVLVEFYAPWCGHCKKLTPIYDELGEKMKDENVEIVKMDATANDVPSEFNVQGFPTIFWVPSDSKKPVSYNGGREVDDFVQYIAKEATSELKGFDRSGKPKKTEL